MTDLIDKAEALATCPFCGGGVSVTTTERVGGIVCDAPSECIGSGLLIVFDLEDMETALAAWSRRALPARGVGVDTLQSRVWPWMMACFGEEIARDKEERGDRLLEEVFELLQSGGYDPARVLALRDYVWSRDVGEPAQEVGGVMITLAAYCLAHGLDMHQAGETELARIWTKVEKIRAKQAAKPKGSALLQAWPAALAPTDAAHVNETPKSEHDAGNVLTAAQAREAALDRIKVASAILPEGKWEVWNSCSFRRITGADGRDGGVLCGVVQGSDGHPDLSMPEAQLRALCDLVNAARELMTEART